MLQSITWVSEPLFGAASFADYVTWVLVAMGAIIALGVLVAALRRKLGPGRQALDEQRGFSIGSIERMWRAGEIDEAEFKVLRRAALGLGAPEQGDENPASSEPGGVSMNDDV